MVIFLSIGKYDDLERRIVIVGHWLVLRREHRMKGWRLPNQGRACRARLVTRQRLRSQPNHAAVAPVRLRQYRRRQGRFEVASLVKTAVRFVIGLDGLGGAQPDRAIGPRPSSNARGRRRSSNEQAAAAPDAARIETLRSPLVRAGSSHGHPAAVSLYWTSRSGKAPWRTRDRFHRPSRRNAAQLHARDARRSEHRVRL
jgi:hypothetical protein